MAARRFKGTSTRRNLKGKLVTPKELAANKLLHQSERGETSLHRMHTNNVDSVFNDRRGSGERTSGSGRRAIKSASFAFPPEGQHHELIPTQSVAMGTYGYKYKCGLCGTTSKKEYYGDDAAFDGLTRHVQRNH